MKASESVWTQSLSITWRRSIGYYQQRFNLLERLDKEGLLKAFKADEDEVGGRLRDNAHEILVHPNGLRGNILQPTGDRARLERAIDLTLETIGDLQVNRIALTVQFIIPVEGDYDKARTSSGQTLLGHVVGDIGIADWAVLMDSKPSASGLEGQFEFGILSKNEIPIRLGRRAGRTGHFSQAAPSIPTFFPEGKRELPDVAMFLDGMWVWTGRGEQVAIRQQFRRVWDEAIAEGTKTVTEILTNLGLVSPEAAGEEGSE
jgi:hypothetical protein